MGNSISVGDLYNHPLIKQMVDNLSSKSNLESLTLPYVIKDKILMSPGVWNGHDYSPDEIKQAFKETDWNDKEIRSLYLDHNDRNASEWIGEIINPRLEKDTVKGDLVIVDKNTAIKLAYGAKMGISPKVHGMDDDGRMTGFVYDNFSVVINPAIKTAYINNSEQLKEGSELDEVFKKYNDTVNMSYSELKKWSETDCSKKASIDRSPIVRNLHLLSTPKNAWGKKEIEWANKTISFVSRMKNAEQGKDASKDCDDSKRDISLKNWAYDPGKKKMAEESKLKPYGDVDYADPGYQEDGVYRYPLDTEKHVKAAWSYINMPKNQKFYSKEQLDKIMDKIKKSAKRFDIEISENIQKMSELAPLEKGKFIEQKHYDTYLSVVNYVNEHGELPSEEFLYEAIARDNLKYNDDYYDNISNNKDMILNNQEVNTMSEENVENKPTEEVQKEAKTEEVTETKTEETKSEEAPAEESVPATSEMSDIKALLQDIVSKITANSAAISEMQSKMQKPVKEEKEEDKKDEKKEEKMSDDSLKVIQEMSEKINVLESKLNEPVKATKKVAEMSQEQTFNADELLIQQLRG